MKQLALGILIIVAGVALRELVKHYPEASRLPLTADGRGALA